MGCKTVGVSTVREYVGMWVLAVLGLTDNCKVPLSMSGFEAIDANRRISPVAVSYEELRVSFDDAKWSFILRVQRFASGINTNENKITSVYIMGHVCVFGCVWLGLVRDVSCVVVDDRRMKQDRLGQ